jgi:hypothetical protein
MKWEEFIPGIVVAVLGAGIIAIVKSTLDGFILRLEDRMMTRRECLKQHDADSEERESIRNNIQNHEERLNAAGA